MSPTAHRRVAAHYHRDGLEEAVLDLLRTARGDLDGLKPADLHGIDEFHVRGAEATADLASLLGDLSSKEVLDVGSGLGGSARHLASRWDCRVTGIDATASYVATARKLSEMVSLSRRTKFVQASALDLPFDDARFDVVWMQHIQMNIEDKPRLTDELERVLRRGGKLAIHEIFSDARPQPYFPVPWAEAASNSFLISAAGFRQLLEARGMETREWIDVTEPALAWATKVVDRLADPRQPGPGVHPVMGETALAKLSNLRRSLQDRRIQVVQAVFSKH